MRKKKTGLLKKLKKGSTALAVGASLFIPQGKAKADEPSSAAPARKSIQQRVADLREKLREQQSISDPSLREKLSQAEKQLQEAPGQDWRKWRNYPGWRDWDDWRNR